MADTLDPLSQRIIPESEEEHPNGDVFATQEEDGAGEHGQEGGVPDTFEELPIEIRSLTER
jgi:hypothetical protein